MELSRTNFRRLVLLHLFSFLLTLASLAHDWFDPALAQLSEQVDALVEAQLGVPGETTLIVCGLAAVASLLWGLACSVGLLWFQRWARFGFWASLLLFVISAIPISGFYVSYTTLWQDLATILESALFGAILLFAYSPEHGGIWFGRSEAQLANAPATTDRIQSA